MSFVLFRESQGFATGLYALELYIFKEYTLRSKLLDYNFLQVDYCMSESCLYI